MGRTKVILEPIKVMYVEAEGGLSDVKQSWETLESRLSNMKGRKFYGTYKMKDKIYCACVAIKNEEEPQELNLAIWTIPGGKYLKEKIIGWSKRTEIIGETFDSMASDSDPDPSRPSIEFYSSQDEVTLLLPIL